MAALCATVRGRLRVFRVGAPVCRCRRAANGNRYAARAVLRADGRPDRRAGGVIQARTAPRPRSPRRGLGDAAVPRSGLSARRACSTDPGCHRERLGAAGFLGGSPVIAHSWPGLMEAIRGRGFDEYAVPSIDTRIRVWLPRAANGTRRDAATDLPCLFG